jgi:hypothetical protein
MTRPKSEHRVVPEGRRKAVPTLPSRAGGGKAVPVPEQTVPRRWFSETAENPAARAKGAVGRADLDRKRPAKRAAPTSKNKEERATSATRAAGIARLDAAFQNVAANQGAPGPDRQDIATVRAHGDEVRAEWARTLVDGSSQPGLIRRVGVPKSGGGQRGLGIPDVADRVVSEAIRQVLEPGYEPTFHASRHGFRPGRSGQTAIEQARGALDEGYEGVVDLDGERFFERVSHPRWMARAGPARRPRCFLAWGLAGPRRAAPAPRATARVRGGACVTPVRIDHAPPTGPGAGILDGGGPEQG